MFFELGADLCDSNLAFTSDEMETSLYGKMLAKTPKAFMHLLDNCVFSVGKRTFVDFFPFYNSDGGSELNILRVI